jgi:hypothetical protein
MFLRLEGEWYKCTKALRYVLSAYEVEPMHTSESLLGNSMVATVSC